MRLLSRKPLQFLVALALFCAAAAMATDFSYTTLVPQTNDNEMLLWSRQAASLATIAQATTVKSTALEASHVLKASAGKLVSLHVFNSKASAQYILVLDSATLTADGAVVLLYPPIYLPATTNMSLTFPVPLTAANGITVCNSSSGSFTKTIGSADCVFLAQVQ